MIDGGPEDRDTKRDARPDPHDVAVFKYRVKAPSQRTVVWILAVVVGPFVIIGLLVVVALIALRVELRPEDPMPPCEPGDGGWVRHDTRFYCVHHYCPPCDDVR